MNSDPLPGNTQGTFVAERFPRWLVAALLVLVGVATLFPVWRFVVQDSWPQLFEVGYHHVPMRGWVEWLSRGQTIGWDHSFFGGHPTYQFYFPGAALLWIALDVVLPSHSAYILVTVLPFPALLVGVFWLGRTWALSRPSALLLGVSSVIAWGIVDLFGSRYYGTLSILYGLFSHAWGVVLGVCYLAAVNRLVKTDGRRRWWWVLAAAGLLTAAFLSHPIPALLVGAASLTLLNRRTAASLLTASGTAAGLTAWWWVPAITQTYMSTHRDLGALPWGQVFNTHVLVLLPAAVWGGWRLRRAVSNSKLLRPGLFLIIIPLLHLLVVPDGDAFHAGGRTLTFWHVAVPSLAVWAMADWVTYRFEVKYQVWGTVMACGLLVVAYPAILESESGDQRLFDKGFVAAKQFDGQLADNNQPLPNCSAALSEFRALPPATFLSVYWGGWWRPAENCRLWMMNGNSTALFGEQHRNIHGLLAESSPTARFYDRAVANATAYQMDIRPYEKHAVFTPINWNRAAAQMMTLGVDFYQTSEKLTPEHPLGNQWVFPVPDVGGVIKTWQVAEPLKQWPSEWSEGTHGEWADLSLNVFSQWDTPHDIVIPVHGAPPDGHPDNPALSTVRPDWSNDQQVAFHASHVGFHYVPVSYHPNWKLVTPGKGIWRAGPNQMVFHVSRVGQVNARFVASEEERVGQAVSLLTVLVLVVVTWNARRSRFADPGLVGKQRPDEKRRHLSAGYRLVGAVKKRLSRASPGNTRGV